MRCTSRELFKRLLTATIIIVKHISSLSNIFDTLRLIGGRWDLQQQLVYR